MKQQFYDAIVDGPIIAMSAKDAREDMDACKEAGMNDYLAKPVELQRLYQVLAEYLENPM